MLTSASHTADVMAAVRQRILSLNTAYFAATPITVEIGSPAQFHPRPETAPPLVTIFVYRIELAQLPVPTSPDTAQALRLHCLITAFCTAGATASESAGTYELRILSHIVRLFMEQPELGPVRIPNALPIGPAADIIGSDLMVDITHRSLDAEDINHIWTTQGDTPYRASIAYGFSFGIVTPSAPNDDGPPVLFPSLQDPNDLTPQSVGVSPQMPTDAPDAKPDEGALVLNTGTPAAPILTPEATHTAGAGNPALPLVAVTETAETLDLTLEKWDGAAGWTDATARLSASSLTSLERQALQNGAPVTPTALTLTDDGNPALLRLSATRPGDAEGLIMSHVFITMEA